MAETSPSDLRTTSKPRWYAPTPAKLLFAVLVMQGVLFLSARYRWFWFNELKGYTVLITLAATAIALLMLVAAVLVSRFFKSMSQFSLATLLLTVPVMGVPCGWLSSEMTLARRLQALVENEEASVVVFGVDQSLGSDHASYQPSVVESWLLSTFGQAFFQEVLFVSVIRLDDEALRELEQFPNLQSLELQEAGVSDAGLKCLQNFSHLRTLGLEHTKISDEGLKHLGALVELEVLALDETDISDDGVKHLEGLKHLEMISLYGTRVSKAGVEWLQERLPKCKINRAVPLGHLCP